MTVLRPARLLQHLRKMPLATALKVGGVVAALIVTCMPLLFWPSGDASTDPTDKSSTFITVPPIEVVTSVLPGTSTTEAEPSVKITVAAVGDVIIHDSVLESAYDPAARTYDFSHMLAPVAPYLAAADYAVCNLESRMAGGTIASSEGSLRFNSPYTLAGNLKAAGIDLAATASNHAADFGWLGVVRTLDALDAVGIAHVGTARSPREKATPVIADIQGIKVAFLDYTAFINSDTNVTGQEQFAINILNVDAAAKEAALARSQGAEVVIAMLHYGMEYRRTPNGDQTTVTEGTSDVEGLLSRGVDVVLGSHPHVVQPIVRVVKYSTSTANDAYAAYSLGNFLTGQRWRYTDSGIIAYLQIEKKEGAAAQVTGISYLPIYVQKTQEEAPRYRVLPVLPGVTPETDTVITREDQERINQVWAELEKLLYRPDEGIVPLDPKDLGLE